MKKRIQKVQKTMNIKGYRVKFVEIVINKKKFTPAIYSYSNFKRYNSEGIG